MKSAINPTLKHGNLQRIPKRLFTSKLCKFLRIYDARNDRLQNEMFTKIPQEQGLSFPCITDAFAMQTFGVTFLLLRWAPGQFRRNSVPRRESASSGYWVLNHRQQESLRLSAWIASAPTKPGAGANPLSCQGDAASASPLILNRRAGCAGVSETSIRDSASAIPSPVAFKYASLRVQQ